jgi:hypothetical protein
LVLVALVEPQKVLLTETETKECAAGKQVLVAI